MHDPLSARGPLLACLIAAVFGSACGMHGTARGPASPGDSSSATGAAGSSRPRPAFVVPQVAAAAEAAPLSLIDADGSALGLTALSARTSIDGPLAATELKLTFHNPEGRVREGRFRVVLPHGAFVSRLAMKIDGSFREADVAELARAREVYESVMHVRRDPLLVEQHGDEELSARVFPIDPHADKEIIVSWIATVPSAAPITLRLRGMAEIGRLDVVATEDGRVISALHDENVSPTDVAMMPSSHGAAVRSGELVVARVVVPRAPGEAKPASLHAGLVLLVDTSASRAPDLAKQLLLVQGLVAALASHASEGAMLTVAAFDQRVVPVYRGPLARFGASELGALRAHGALGASDLERALGWTAGEARAIGASRAVIIGDGLATAGSADAARLRDAARALAAGGVARLDVVGVGEVRSDAVLRALTVGALAADGIVIDGSLPPREIAAHLLEPSRSKVEVRLPGARWIWPTSLEGVQAGDERFVYAELPAGAPAVVSIDGQATTLTPLAAPAPLLGRAIAKAKVDALVARGQTHGYDDALRERIVTLSRSQRVPSPFTALLVTESESDRAALLRPTPPRITAGAPARASAPASAPARGGSVHGRPVTQHVVRTPQLRVAAMMSVNGRLPPESIQRSVRQGFGRFRACYELGLLRRGRLQGRVTTTFVIDRDGSVSKAASAGPDVGDSEVVDCIAAAFRALQFPRPEGGVATVTYPLVLGPIESDGLDGDVAERRALERSPMASDASVLMPRVANGNPFRPSPPPPPRPPPSPWAGMYAEAHAALDRDDPRQAFALASAARARDGRDVVALLALGESLEAASLPELAARAYGSIADLYPHSADMLRVAAGRLDALGEENLPLAIELWRRAKDDRPDHPAGHHALAMALLRAGAHDEAFETLRSALAISFDARYSLAHSLLDHDLAFVAAAWATAEPSRADLIDSRARLASLHYPLTRPSLRFVLSWESDASDLDLALTGPAGATVGTVDASARDGYGPESSAVDGARGARPSTRARVRFARRGPTGLPMGIVHVMEQDGRGHVSVRPRPFVVMTEGAEVDLGTFD